MQVVEKCAQIPFWMKINFSSMVNLPGRSTILFQFTFVDSCLLISISRNWIESMKSNICFHIKLCFIQRFSSRPLIQWKRTNGPCEKFQISRKQFGIFYRNASNFFFIRLLCSSFFSIEIFILYESKINRITASKRY